MNKTIISVILFSIVILSQNYTEADEISEVQLKNGSIIKGEIIGQLDERTIIFKNFDGTLKYYDIKDIKDIIKYKAKINPKTLGNAFALSFIPPLFLPIQGCGQIYNDQIDKGLLFYSIGNIRVGLIYYGYSKGYFSNHDEGKIYVQSGIFLYLASWIWSSVDAYKTAKRNRFIKLSNE